jgi:hypothetical protein
MDYGLRFVNVATYEAAEEASCVNWYDMALDGNQRPRSRRPDGKPSRAGSRKGHQA